MVAKISIGNSLYGALAYNGEKINEAKGRLLTTNRIYNDGTGTIPNECDAFSLRLSVCQECASRPSGLNFP